MKKIIILILSISIIFLVYHLNLNSDSNKAVTNVIDSNLSDYSESQDYSPEGQTKSQEVTFDNSTSEILINQGKSNIEKAKEYLESLGIRDDRYSHEELEVIQKQMEGVPLTQQEAELHFAYFLDMMFRLDYENMDVKEQNQKDNIDWLVAHTYDDSLDYWHTLSEDGSLRAAETLGTFYQNVKFSEKAYQAFEVGFIVAKKDLDKGNFAFEMAESLSPEDELLSAALYYLSKNKYSSNKYTTKYDDLVNKYGLDKIKSEADSLIIKYE